jgi:hypothetical protein
MIRIVDGPSPYVSHVAGRRAVEATQTIWHAPPAGASVSITWLAGAVAAAVVLVTMAAGWAQPAYAADEDGVRVGGSGNLYTGLVFAGGVAPSDSPADWGMRRQCERQTVSVALTPQRSARALHSGRLVVLAWRAARQAGAVADVRAYLRPHVLGPAVCPPTVLVCGYCDRTNAATVQTAAATMRPARMDPQPSRRRLPDGYSTTAADPGAIIADEQHKTTTIDGERSTSNVARDPAYGRAVSVPVLIAVGEHDGLACDPDHGLPGSYERSADATRPGDNPRIIRTTGAVSHTRPGDQGVPGWGRSKGNGGERPGVTARSAVRERPRFRACRDGGPNRAASHRSDGRGGQGRRRA